MQQQQLAGQHAQQAHGAKPPGLSPDMHTRLVDGPHGGAPGYYPVDGQPHLAPYGFPAQGAPHGGQHGLPPHF